MASGSCRSFGRGWTNLILVRWTWQGTPSSSVMVGVARIPRLGPFHLGRSRSFVIPFPCPKPCLSPGPNLWFGRIEGSTWDLAGFYCHIVVGPVEFLLQLPWWGKRPRCRSEGTWAAPDLGMISFRRHLHTSVAFSVLEKKDSTQLVRMSPDTGRCLQPALGDI